MLKDRRNVKIKLLTITLLGLTDYGSCSKTPAMKNLAKKVSGDLGEQEVVDLVPCPNCSKKLMKLPSNYPLYDVQCTGCSFRAQVKTNQNKPKNIIFGAGWQVMSKVLKSGFMVP